MISMENIKDPEQLREMLARHEGTKYRPYKCSQGFLTIGIGHNIDAVPLPEHMAVQLAKSGYLSPDMVEELFEMDLAGALSSSQRAWPGFDGFSSARQNALVDFMFNLGENRVKKFGNTTAAINEGRWNDAAEGIKKSLYWKQLGGDPPGTDDGKLERPEEIYRMLKEG